jgi:hypothetical protein
MRTLLARLLSSIEAQEDAGQAVFVVSESLPIDGTAGYETELRKLGFVLGEPADELFMHAKLPQGWRKAPTEHSMHSSVLDDRGRCRGAVFYKAAFYDRRACVRWLPAVQCVVEPEGECSEAYIGRVLLQEQEVHRTERMLAARGDAYNVRMAIYCEAELWAMEHYPDMDNPFAYWS